MTCIRCDYIFGISDQYYTNEYGYILCNNCYNINCVNRK